MQNTPLCAVVIATICAAIIALVYTLKKRKAVPLPTPDEIELILAYYWGTMRNVNPDQRVILERHLGKLDNANPKRLSKKVSQLLQQVDAQFTSLKMLQSLTKAQLKNGALPSTLAEGEDREEMTSMIDEVRRTYENAQAMCAA